MIAILSHAKGKRVQVYVKSSNVVISGKMTAVTEDVIVLESDGFREVVSMNDVSRVRIYPA